MAIRPSRHVHRATAGRRTIGLLTTLVVAASFMAASTGTGAAQTMPNPWLTERRVLNLAHGGGLHEAPQGTLYAYKTALERGANALEIDVHITTDGHVVAIHDSTVDRTTNGSGCVATKTLAELKALDAAHTFVPGRGPVGGLDEAEYPLRGVAAGTVPPPAGFAASDFTIVTLEEIFQAQPDALAVIELKPTEQYQSHNCPSEVASLPPDQRPDLAAEVARLIDAYGMTDKVMVASFVDDLLHHFMDLAPDVSTSFPMGESIALYVAHVGGQPFPNPRGHEAIQVPRSYGDIEITAELVAWSRENGVAVHFWTINDPDEMELLLGWGADGLITDRPAVLAGLLPDPVDPVDPTTPPASRPETSTSTSAATTTTGPSSSTTTSSGSTTTAAGPGGATTTSPAEPPATSDGQNAGGSGARPGGASRAPTHASTPLPRTGTKLGAMWAGLVLLAAGAIALTARRQAAAGSRRS